MNRLDKIPSLISEIDKLLREAQSDANTRQVEITSLEKQKEDLTAEIVALESKKRELTTDSAVLRDEIKTNSEVLALEEIDDPVLKKCRSGSCEYRDRLERHVQRNEKRLLEGISKQNDFHFFLTYFASFAKGDDGGVIGSHEAILAKTGCFWWGKFFKQWNAETGKWDELEPYGESIDVERRQDLIRSIRQKVDERIRTRQPVYLYLYNPNPPEPCLHVGNIQQLFCGTGQALPMDADSEKPACAFVPDYLLLDPAERSRRHCQGCKRKPSDRCGMRFLCNFWFKVGAPEGGIVGKNEPLKVFTKHDLQEELKNLIDGVTGEALNFAIPKFFPLFVFQKNPIAYFGARPRRVEELPTVDFARKEGGHTGEVEIKSFVHRMFGAYPYFVGARLNRQKRDAKPQSTVVDRDPTEENILTLILSRDFHSEEGVSPTFDILLDEGDPTPGKKVWIMKALQNWCEKNR